MRTFSVMYDHNFSTLANHQIRHQATHKVGCQPGDRLHMVTSIFLRGLRERERETKSLQGKSLKQCMQEFFLF